MENFFVQILKITNISFPIILFYKKVKKKSIFKTNQFFLCKKKKNTTTNLGKWVRLGHLV